ncbi:MAG: choline dehydrogenase [Alphaproteobacteria bacterium]|nr:MAG: choline dehydrogenase [Alphaproteobacteria bacterium]
MEFDYVIVGAGSAGCVLAERLSAGGRARVLVLEAGGADRHPWIRVPLGYAFTFSDPRVNWRYTARPDPGLLGREAYWPRGKVVGGSSSINAMAWVRGLPGDFDDWQEAGAEGWGWPAMRAAFDALETVLAPGEDGRMRASGNGPVPVSDLGRDMHPFSDNFLAAARDLGWPVTGDMNAPGQAGIGRYRSTVRAGRRVSAADAFLKPALRRGGVRLLTHALVERIALDGRRARGVHFRRAGRAGFARARREVILCAGAVNSPQILQLSGLGPAPLLRAHGIEVVRDLPEVGRGLQDHLAITHYFRSNAPTLNTRLGTPLGRVLAGVQYVATRRGPLGVPVNQVGGFVRSGPAQSAPDLQIYCNPASYSVPADGKPRIDRAPGFLLCAQPCRPTSRGEIRIASPDPTRPPDILPNSLATEADRRAAIAASRAVQALAATPTLSALIRSAHEPDIRAMGEAELLENFRARAGSVFHASCTCRMGRRAGDSVLDARLRVHGVAGLRVVDASAFPNVTSGNTNAPTMALALRAAGLILEDAGRAGEAARESA